MANIDLWLGTTLEGIRWKHEHQIENHHLLFDGVELMLSICFSFTTAIDMCWMSLRFKILLMALSFYNLTFTATFQFQHEPIRRLHIAELNLFIFRVSFCQCYEIFNEIGLILLSIRIECNRNNNWHLHKCILEQTRHLVSANKFTNCMERNLHNNMSQTRCWFLFYASKSMLNV